MKSVILSKEYKKKLKQIVKSRFYSTYNKPPDSEDGKGILVMDGKEILVIYFHDDKERLHRDGDLPAVIWENGRQEWYYKGFRHRELDEPSIVDLKNQRFEFWKHGLRHRGRNKPAVFYSIDKDGEIIQSCNYYRFGEKYDKNNYREVLLEEKRQSKLNKKVLIKL